MRYRRTSHRKDGEAEAVGVADIVSFGGAWPSTRDVLEPVGKENPLLVLEEETR